MCVCSAVRGPACVRLWRRAAAAVQVLAYVSTGGGSGDAPQHAALSSLHALMRLPQVGGGRVAHARYLFLKQKKNNCVVLGELLEIQIIQIHYVARL